ncbi:MAG TPA: hypothetical protein VI299_02820 [Polyangiales bacterium]
MAVASAADPGAPIEDTLWAVSVEGMDRDRLRKLALLTTWWGVHGALVNADRLYDLISQTSSERVRAYWSALALQRGKDPRFRRYAALAPGDDVGRARAIAVDHSDRARATHVRF